MEGIVDVPETSIQKQMVEVVIPHERQAVWTADQIGYFLVHQIEEEIVEVVQTFPQKAHAAIRRQQMVDGAERGGDVNRSSGAQNPWEDHVMSAESFRETEWDLLVSQAMTLHVFGQASAAFHVFWQEDSCVFHSCLLIFHESARFFPCGCIFALLRRAM